ncbi:MAG: flagellar basal body-associated FliL family protein [Sphingomonadales bacterium]
MADQDDDIDVFSDDPGDLPKKKWTGKKIVMIAAPLLLLIGGGVGAMMFMGGSKQEMAEGEMAEKEPEEPTALIFYEVPDMMINLNDGGRKSTFLKLSISLEVDRASTATTLETQLPRIIDNFQLYLRQLRLEDLSGSAGMFRLKEELLRRVNQTVAPAKVNDVLFKEILVQ